MKIQQLVFSSSRSQTQNQLVSQSSDIGHELTGEIANWIPTTTDIHLGERTSICCFRPDESTVAVSRTFVGARDPEVDGARRLLTHVALMDCEQLAVYRNNTALLIHTLLSSGNLILPLVSTSKLTTLEVPESVAIDFAEYSWWEWDESPDQIVHALKVHGTIAVLGDARPLVSLWNLLASLPFEERLSISYATGLKLADTKQFSLQFFTGLDPVLEKDLAKRQIRTINFRSNLKLTKSEIA